MSTRVPHFQFFWYPDHFKYESKAFNHSYARLSKQEKADYDRLHEFVNSFPPVTMVDEEGNHLLDSRGSPWLYPVI